jgi:Cof subfamily protein (haloacid dehalogenase superfamily)
LLKRRCLKFLQKIIFDSIWISSAESLMGPQKTNPFNIKALIFDIDGTILTSRRVMSDNTFRALLECKKSGYIISTATARSGRLVFRDHEIPGDKRELLDRGISYNGASVFDTTYNFSQHLPVSGNLVKEITDCIHSIDDTLQIALQYDDIYHSFKYPMNDNELLVLGFSREEIVAYDAYRSNPATKIMIYSGTNWNDISGDLSVVYARLLDRFADSVNPVLADSRRSIYITSKYASKGNAIRTLISLHDIKPEEVAVFGDDTPDMDMFGVFGCSVAMGNAHESLKSKAMFVTKTNDEDGVVYALENYLKIL